MKKSDSQDSKCMRCETEGNLYKAVEELQARYFAAQREFRGIEEKVREGEEKTRVLQIIARRMNYISESKLQMIDAIDAIDAIECSCEKQLALPF